MAAQQCKCGTWNNDSAKYCRNCGRELYQQDQTDTFQNNDTPTSESSNSGIGIVMKLFLTVLCFAVVIGVIVATDGIGTVIAAGLYSALKKIWD